MNNVQIFENEELGNIRTVTIDGEPWFVGKDVAEALGYSNASEAVMNYVGAEDKAEIVICDLAIGRKQNTTIINVLGLHSLICVGRVDEAVRIRGDGIWNSVKC